MSDVALANEAAARTPTGEIRDQSPAAAPPKETTSTTMAPSPETTTQTTPSTTTEAKPTEAKAETKPEGDKPSIANEKPPEPPKGAPEKYEAFKVPDGFEMPEEVTKEVGTLFKELNLNQTQAQQLIDYYAKQSQQAAEAPFKLWQDTQEKWRNEVKLDPEIGPKMDQVRTTIGKALEALDPQLAEGFRAAMDYTGAGNNLAFIKTFYRLASMVTEGGHVAGSAPSQFGQRPPNAPERPNAARALYPNLP